MKKLKFKRETEDIEWLYDDRDKIESSRRPVLDENRKPQTPGEIHEEKAPQSTLDESLPLGIGVNTARSSAQ